MRFEQCDTATWQSLEKKIFLYKMKCESAVCQYLNHNNGEEPQMRGWQVP